MPSQNVFGSSASTTALIGRTLGDAYTYVKIVADQIASIKTIAENIVAVKDAAESIKRTILQITDTAPALGNTSFTALPNGVTAAIVLDSMVIIETTDNILYSESSGHFTSRINAGFLEVAVDAGAPATMAGGTIRWTLTHSE